MRINKKMLVFGIIISFFLIPDVKGDLIDSLDPIIYINGVICQYEDFEGNGTYSNPYIIEGLNIKNTSDERAIIMLVNIDKYIVIRNNTIQSELYKRPLMIWKCSNIIIENNNFTYQGISVGYSNYIKIINNTIEISKNIVSRGVYIVLSNFIMVINNTIFYDPPWYISSLDYNISYSPYVGMKFDQSNNCTIFNNTINHFYSAIELEKAGDNQIIDNRVIGGSLLLFRLNGADLPVTEETYSEIYNNTISNNIFEFTERIIEPEPEPEPDPEPNSPEQTPTSDSNQDTGNTVGETIYAVVVLIGGFIIWICWKSNAIQQNTCPKCKESDNYFKDMKKSYDKRTDKVRYYQRCSGCGYTKYKDEPTSTTVADETVNNLKDTKEKVRKVKIRTQKLEKMLKLSDKIRLDVMQDVLDLDRKLFNNLIFDWAADYGFRISGDYIIIENADIDGFISSLDKQFDKWQAQSEFKK